MRRYFFIFLGISLLIEAQTTIFSYAGGGTSLPSGWSSVNGNTSNDILQNPATLPYFLIEQGGDTLITNSIDLSSYGTAEFELEVASFGTSPYTQLKLEVSFNGGATFTQSQLATTPTGTSYINGGLLTLVTVSSAVVIRFTNTSTGSGGKGVRMRNLKLTGIGTPCTTPINVSAAYVSIGISSLDVSWAHSACFDEVIVFIDTSSGITTSPSGGSGTYTGNAAYTSVGQCVYSGTANTFTMTGLALNKLYYFEIFTRKGTSWSSGIETSGMPLYNGLIISTTNTPISLDFDTTVDGVNNGQFNGSGFKENPSSGQLNAFSWSISGLSAGDLNFGDTATTSDFARGLSAGGTINGGLYAFTVGAGNRAFGVQATASDFTPGYIKLRILNKTAASISKILLEYDIYTYNDQDRGTELNLEYSLNNSTYTAVSGLNYTSQEAKSSSTAWQVNRRFVLLEGLSLSPDSFVYFSWNANDAGGSGSRDELALDNITISFHNTTPNKSSINGGSYESISAVNQSANLAGTVLTSFLHLDDAIVSTNNFDIAIRDSASHGNETSYIETNGTGKVIKEYTVADSFVYPVGRNGFSPITLYFTSGTFSSANASVRVVDDVLAAVFGTPDTLSRYWELNQTGISNFNCNIRAFYRASDVYGNENHLWCFKYDSIMPSIGDSVYPNQNMLYYDSATSFSDITAAGYAALPVHLVSLKGVQTSGSNLLTWQTTSEQNSAFYEIHKSLDNITFDKVTSIPASGNSHKMIQYSFLDVHPYSLTYYRLRQCDYDGSCYWIGNVALEQAVHDDLLVMQSDVNVTIQFSDARDTYRYRFMDITGRCVYSGIAVDRLNMPTTAMRSGLYILYLENDTGKTHLKKVVIK